MSGTHAAVYLPRSEIPDEDVLALALALTVFRPTGFRAKPQARQFSRLGRKSFWEQLRLNLLSGDKMRMDAHAGIFNRLFLRYEPVTDILCIYLWLNDDRYDTVQEIVHQFAQSHPILSASMRTSAESDWNSYLDCFTADGTNTAIAKIHVEHPEISEVNLIYQKTTPPKPLIDKQQFAGFTTEFDGVWFGCTHEMWFGRNYDKYLPLQTLAAFRDCAQNETLANGTVHIVMYDAPDAFRSEESLRRAFAYRAHTDYVNLAADWRKRLSAAPERRGFANMEIVSGTFPHGGVKRVLTYLDADGRPVIRKKASQVHISERGADGKELFLEIQPYAESEVTPC